jgi:hypothetical protein
VDLMLCVQSSDQEKPVTDVLSEVSVSR